jgi:hypothetical protein
MAAPLSRSHFLPLRKLPPGEAFLTPQAEADYNCPLFKKSYMAPERSLPGGTFLIPTLKADYIAAYFQEAPELTRLVGRFGLNFQADYGCLALKEPFVA